ncbi:cell division ATP-binding protein FtsE [Ectothiorhodospira sp. BSL-9]|uniref:cell division ATP-binding protein FtsE n=1 Tax=Ectothiorhodospira sp. BSL-9 TaxID=1442136 RepID=UPI0007B45B53|nr:cell division ATP-binding protein FtsE [Ectothiorhodospira sp. BSL-9]ANB01418.1 cell division protein FtsE [Ectothiorhodospira sp. BSL-9]TVQ69770.1 MAG: cell division ATP-binding protein FtsE [Chromatiaceae bacterium]
MIHLKNVTKRYPTGHEALSRINLKLDKGAMAFLTGHSGAGKSTLLKLIALIERPTRGRLIVNDQDLADLAPRQVPYFRRQIGIIFQDHHLLHDRSVFDNVALPLVIQGYRQHEIARRARAALDRVGLLHKEGAAPITLSSGEQQRVGIARAVVHKPAILLADEPTGNLDPDLSREIMELFIRFNQVGTTVMIASHDLELISSLGKPMVRLHEGRLQLQRQPEPA